MAKNVRPPDGVLVFTRQQARDVDHDAVEQYRMPSIVLMENASRGVSEVALRTLGGCVRGPDHHAKPVVIVCGSGNNGGDGYAAGRHLHNAGQAVVFLSLGEPDERSDAAINRTICRRMGMSFVDSAERSVLNDASLIVDAIFGTGLDRAVEGTARGVIERINDAPAPVVSVDLPSGLGCDSGEPFGVAVRAACTASFLGWKRGFLVETSRRWTGEIEVVDIGVPRALMTRHGATVDDETT